MTATNPSASFETTADDIRTVLGDMGIRANGTLVAELLGEVDQAAIAQAANAGRGADEQEKLAYQAIRARFEELGLKADA